MSVDPMQMLQQLEAQQPPEQIPQEPSGTEDPQALLRELDKGQKTTDVDTTVLKNLSESVVRGDIKQVKPTKAQAIEKLKQSGADMMVGLAGGDGDFKPENMTEALAGMSTEDIATRLAGTAPAFAQGLKEAGQGGVQLTFDVLEGSGLAPKGLTEYYTKLSDKQRNEFEKEFNEKFGDIADFNFTRGVGTAVPSLIASPLAVARTVKGTIAAGTAFSAALGGAEFIPEDSEQERMVNTLKGAGLGFLLSAGANTVVGLKNWLRRKVGGASLETTTSKKGIELMERTGVDLKLSQITDDPLIQELEQVVRRGGITMAAERTAREAESKSIRGVLAFWRKTAASIKGTTGNFGERLKGAFDKTLGDASNNTGLLGLRRTQGNTDFSAALKASNGAKNISVDTFKKNALELIKKYRSSLSTEKKQLARELIKTLKRPDVRKGKVTAKGLQDILETMGKDGAKSGRIWKDIDPTLTASTAKFLFKGASKDLNNAITSGVKGSHELKIARDNYQIASAKITELRDSALFNMFGGRVPKTNEELGKVIFNMKPDKLKSTMGLLSKSDPGLHRELQRHWIQSHLSKAIKTKELGLERFDPKEMLKLADNDVLLPIFNNRALRKQVVDGIRLSQRVISNSSKAAGTGQVLLMKAAGVLASRDKTFVARLATELITPKAVSGYVLKKEGIEILKTMAKTKNIGVWATGLMKLNNLKKEEQEK